MKYTINGSIMQTVAIDLAPGEVVYSQTNTMCWMNEAIRMDTHTGGGLFAGLKRSFAGGSFFVTDFIAEGDGHTASAAAAFVARASFAQSSRLRLLIGEATEGLAPRKRRDWGDAGDHREGRSRRRRRESRRSHAVMSASRAAEQG